MKKILFRLLFLVWVLDAIFIGTFGIMAVEEKFIPIFFAVLLLPFILSLGKWLGAGEFIELDKFIKEKVLNK